MALMKKLLLVSILMGLALQGWTQQKTVVFGNLGVENVNIMVIHTQYGTSTDPKGHYRLPLFDKEKEIALFYSCIGYYDTIIQLTPKLLQNDSIEISFKMRKQEYSLQEVGVTATSDFYRTKGNRTIADMAFYDSTVILLENTPHTSTLSVLDSYGVKQEQKDFDTQFESLYLDAFHNIIVVGKDSCLQINLTEGYYPFLVSTFSRELYREGLLKILFEFNGAYIIKSTVHDQGPYYLKYNHGKSQDYLYVLSDDPTKTKHPLCSFLDTVGYLICQQILNSLVADYHQAVAEQGGVDEIYEGVWDGYLVRLAQTPGSIATVQKYCHFLANEYHIIPLRFSDYLQFIDLDNYEIVEINKDFEVSARRTLKVVGGEEYFKNVFLEDTATGKIYGLFTNKGVNYIGLYNPKTGTVSMEQKASKGIYPRVFKVHDGYAYSVYFDKTRNQGVINRVRINIE